MLGSYFFLYFVFLKLLIRMFLYFVFLSSWILFFIFTIKKRKKQKYTKQIHFVFLYFLYFSITMITSKNAICIFVFVLNFSSPSQIALCPFVFVSFFRHAVKEQNRESINVCCILIDDFSSSLLYFL